MLKYSIPTVLIPTQQWVCKSGNRGGSVACTEEGRRNEVIIIKPTVRVSCVWLNCYCLRRDSVGRKDDPVSHGDLGDILTFITGFTVRPYIQQSQRAFSEKVNGVKSQPNHNASSHSVNTGSSKLVIEVNNNLYDDGVPIVLKSQPVMGMTIGNQSGSVLLYKLSAMIMKEVDAEGKWSSLCTQLMQRWEDY